MDSTSPLQPYAGATADDGTGSSRLDTTNRGHDLTLSEILCSDAVVDLIND